MTLPEPDSPQRNGTLLRFCCGSCGHDLEAPLIYAGVEGPCPLCGTAVRAPDVTTADPVPLHKEHSKRKEVKSAGGLHLPPLDEETGLVDCPEGFWKDEEASSGIKSTGFDEACQDSVSPGRANECLLPKTGAPGPNPEEPNPRTLPQPRPRVPLTRDEEEAAEAGRMRKKEMTLRFFDAALLLLFAGTLVTGGAAVAFTQSKRASTPLASPELSRQVMERMEQTGRQRDLAVQQAREVMQHWLTAVEPASVDPWCLPGDPAPAIPGLGVGTAETRTGIADYEFIQARRIPGTERFLTTFEVLADPPMVVPVEGTPAGPRLHGRAIVQQQSGSLAKFLASQGHGEAVFYVLLRPGPASMTDELTRARPDLKPFLHVAVEPAFPADGASACLACMAPESEAAAIFAKRAHDPGLRPAVVKLAWRQHRESGNYVQLVSFEPNAWSRH